MVVSSVHYFFSYQIAEHLLDVVLVHGCADEKSAAAVSGHHVSIKISEECFQ